MLRRNQPDELTLDLSRIMGEPIPVNAEMGTNVRLAILAAPSRTTRRGKGDSHPDLPKITTIALERGRIGKIIPLQKISGTENVVKDKR